MDPLFYVGSALYLVAAALYLVVGRVVERRPVSEPNRLAIRLFAIWWYSLGGLTLVGLVVNFLGVAGRLNLAAFLALTLFNIFVICVALWALLYYLLYLFTAKQSILPWLTIFYILFYFGLTYFIFDHVPNGIKTTNWGVELTYATPIGRDPFILSLFFFLLLPQILGALALFTLFFRVEDREQKFRIATVSWSIVLWFGSSLVAGLANVAESDAWQLTSRLIGLAAACAILIAYVPPPGLRRWFAAGTRAPKVASAGREDPNRRVAPVGSS